MFKHIPLMMSILAVFLTACAGQVQGTPTTSPADIQNTAVSAAWTMVATTQMALPTATLVPPTDIPSSTPLPTFTPELLPTTPPELSIPTFPPPLVQPSPTTVSSSGSRNCNQILAVAEAGKTVPVRIQNLTNGEVLLSLHLSPNTFGQCGYMPGVPLIMKGAAVTLNLPTGIWSFYGMIDYGKSKSGNSYGSFTVQSGGSETVKIIDK